MCLKMRRIACDSRAPAGPFSRMAGCARGQGNRSAGHKCFLLSSHGACIAVHACMLMIWLHDGGYRAWTNCLPKRVQDDNGIEQAWRMAALDQRTTSGGCALGPTPPPARRSTSCTKSPPNNASVMRIQIRILCPSHDSSTGICTSGRPGTSTRTAAAGSPWTLRMAARFCVGETLAARVLRVERILSCGHHRHRHRPSDRLPIASVQCPNGAQPPATTKTLGVWWFRTERYCKRCRRRRRESW